MNSSQFEMSRSEVDFFYADADHHLVVLAQLAHEREKSESPLMITNVSTCDLVIAEIERVDDHADIGGILAGHAHMRNFDSSNAASCMDFLKSR